MSAKFIVAVFAILTLLFSIVLTAFAVSMRKRPNKKIPKYLAIAELGSLMGLVISLVVVIASQSKQ